ncbi:MAG TPA: chemotaxis protein CheW [Gemmatimonadales bacterium]|nr:chemotaxis protein CheW [Gemmatimonadales bacterium]
MSPAAAALVVARVGTERYGFEVAAVREIVTVAGVVDVPTVSPVVRGVMPHRDHHVALVSLAALLTGAAPSFETARTAVVVTTGEADLAVEVDEVEDVVDGGAEQVAPAAPGDAPVRGVWRCGGNLVTVLDAAMLGERVTALRERER